MHESTALTDARPRVAFQGEHGAFSEEAVATWFDGGAVAVPCREFHEVGAAVRAGAVGFGLLPVENSLVGSVVAAYDVLAASELTIVGEVIRPIRHCLLGVTGASLEALRRVISHPVALGQCTGFLSRHPAVEAVAVYDTAGAAKEVAERGDPGVAAIAAAGAAGRYGLAILARDLQDRSDNQTRFLVVARPGTAPPARSARPAPRKSALLIETENRPGALVRVLSPLAAREINLAKLEARPGLRPWSYRFFLEIEADAGAAPAAEAIEELRRHAAIVRILGCFPRWVPE